MFIIDYLIVGRLEKMAGAVGIEPTRADLESAVLAVRPHPENETTLLDTNFLFISKKSRM